MQELPEARDDEQRVVDPDSQPDHRDQDRRDRVDVGHAGQDEQQEERSRNGRDRERDRDHRGREGAEDDEQDDDRRQQAEGFRGPLLEGRELGFAVVLDPYAGGLDRLADGLLHRDDGVTVLVPDHPVELRLRIGDPSVVREGVLAEGIADALEAGLVLGRLELRSPELRNRALDRGLPLGGVEPLALGSGEDDVQDAALLGRELGLDQVGRFLGVRSRDLELVAQAAAHGPDEHDE